MIPFEGWPEPALCLLSSRPMACESSLMAAKSHAHCRYPAEHLLIFVANLVNIVIYIPGYVLASRFCNPQPANPNISLLQLGSLFFVNHSPKTAPMNVPLQLALSRTCSFRQTLLTLNLNTSRTQRLCLGRACRFHRLDSGFRGNGNGLNLGLDRG